MECKRNYPRYKMKQEINLSLQYYNPNIKIVKKGTLVNISQQGLQFESDSENLQKIYNIGDIVYIFVNFIAKIKTIIVVEIVWTKENYCGGIIVSKQAKRCKNE